MATDENRGLDLKGIESLEQMVLIGFVGDNYLKGGDGHDMLIAIRGDNVIDGGVGEDTWVYRGGNRADYKVTDKVFGIFEIDKGRSTDFVTNIEEIQSRTDRILSRICSTPTLPLPPVRHLC